MHYVDKRGRSGSRVRLQMHAVVHPQCWVRAGPQQDGGIYHTSMGSITASPESFDCT
jgi:hypothetical protein